jgi:hypothetical protein
MAHQHPTQLMVCHELIAGDARVHDSATAHESQYCQLGAMAWCIECGYYVCDIHRATRHGRHATQTRAAEDTHTAEVEADRRDGADRRAGM